MFGLCCKRSWNKEGASVMNVLDEIIAMLWDLPEDLNRLVASSLKSDERAVIDDIEAQLNEGKDSKGVNIRPPYAKSTIKVKRAEGKPYDRVTLKDTGKNFSKMKLVANPNGHETAIVGNTKYHPDLLKRYQNDGQDPFGLSSDNRRKFFERTLKSKLYQFMNDFKQPIR